MKKIIIFLISMFAVIVFAEKVVTTQNIVNAPVPPGDTVIVSIPIGETEGRIAMNIVQCDTITDSIAMIAYTSPWKDSLTTKEDSCMNVSVWNLDGKLHVAKFLNIKIWNPDADTFNGKIILSKQ